MSDPDPYDAIANRLIAQFADSLYRPTPESHSCEALFNQLAIEFATALRTRDQAAKQDDYAETAQLRAEYAKVVAERDGLLNADDHAETAQLRAEYAKVVAERDGLLNADDHAENAQLRAQYAKIVAERDGLLNTNDKLQRRLQDAVRTGSVRKGAKDVHQDRPPFPQTLAPQITIVDVGGQNLVNEDHIYTPLTLTGRAKVVAFEPLKDKAEERRGEANLVMLNHFVGQGGPARFHVAQFDPTSSLLEPNLDFLRQFVALADMCAAVRTEEVITTRLDDIPQIVDCDFLKIDVQGGELAVLKGGADTLASAVCVHSEMEFAPVYKDQPLFADVDLHLRTAGFELMDMMNAGYARYAALDRGVAESRLMWAEAVYFRSPESLADDRKLLAAAFIAHTNYGMYDLAAHYLQAYEARTGAAVLADYLTALRAGLTGLRE